MPFSLEENYIAAAEQQIGGRLPSAYRLMMMQENGGLVRLGSENWWLHPVFDTSDKKRLKRTCNHIVHETNTRFGIGGFPENGVEIAHNGSGDSLLFLKEGEDYLESVYLFDHEMQVVSATKWTAGDLNYKRERA